MSSLTIREMLEQVGDKRIKTVPVLFKALTFSRTISNISENKKASEILKDMEMFDKDVLNSTIPEIFNPQDHDKLHTCKTAVMWIMLVLISAAYAATNIYISFKNSTILDWETMMLTLIGPILVVLYDRGVISRENKDMLSVLSGKTPAMTIMESISQRIANGPKSSKKSNTEDID